MHMHVTDLPARHQDYLKAIFDLQEWGTAHVTLSELATHLNQRPSTASEAVKRLAKQGLVEHHPYGDIQLSADGRRMAVAMVRRHRLLETYLCRQLGYTLDEVHEEAEVLEHAVSDTFIARIAAHMGHPVRDPHGDPIPDAEGQVTSHDVFSLGDATTGARLTIDRVNDRDPQLLRYLEDKGVLPGATVEVLDRAFADMAEFRLADGSTVQLPVSSLESILVCSEEPAGETS